MSAPLRASVLLAMMAMIGFGCGGDPPEKNSPPPLSRVELAPTSVTLEALGDSATIAATAYDTAGEEMTFSPGDFTWSSDDDGVARIEEGLVTAVGVGETRVTAKLEDKSASARVVVREPPRPPELASVVVEPSDYEFEAIGEAFTFRATALDGEGREIETSAQEFTWSSSDPLVARVDIRGYVTAESDGEAFITASLDGQSGAARVIVPPEDTSNEPAAITVSPDDLLFSSLGESMRLEAALLNASGDELTFDPAELMWSSGDETVARVDGEGRVEAAGVGETIITVSYDTFEAQARVRVERGQGMCNRFDWCWENPLPFGMHLSDVWTGGPDQAWATGLSGTLLYFDGTDWQELETSTSAGLHGAWGASANDVWFVGDAGTILRWNGTALLEMAPPSAVDFADVHGTSSDDVWLVGSWGEYDLNHWNGTSWTGYGHGSFFSPDVVFAASDTDAWAGGYSETFLRWNGQSWQDAGDGNTTHALWGFGADDIWHGGRGGLRHFDGDAWSEVLEASEDWVHAIGGVASNDLWIGGGSKLRHYDGQAWTDWASGVLANGLSFSATDNGWAVGRGGSILHWNGVEWQQHSGFGVDAIFHAAWAAGADDAWFFGTRVMRWKDGRLVDYGPLFENLYWYDVVGAWSASPDDVWVVGPKGMAYRWDGAAWNTVATPVDTNLTAIWGTAADDVYAVTARDDDLAAAYVLHWDGSAWSIHHQIALQPARTLYAVGGTGTDDVWVGGDDATVWHYDGAQWSARQDIVTSSYATVHDFWTSSTGELWMASSAGLQRRTGETWEVIAEVDRAIARVTGSPEQGVWALAGNHLNPESTLFHFDGTTWSTVETGAGQGVRATAVTTGDVWIVGDEGGILRRR